MKRRATASQRSAQGQVGAPKQPVAPAFIPPYPQSWINRLMGWVDRLPGPFWVVYLAAAVVFNLALAAAYWSVGRYPVGTFTRLDLILGVQIPGALALAHYLNRSAVKAIDDFRPALIATEAESLTLRYRLVTLPRSAAAWAGVTSIGAFAIGTFSPLIAGQPLLGPDNSNPLAGPLVLFGTTPSPIPATVYSVLLLFSWWTYGAVLYHILRQLAVISRIYSQHTRVNLFRLAPLYAFSRQTARTSIGLMVLLSVSILAVPDLMRQTGVSVGSALMLFLALAVFIVPLVGVHRLLAREKERLVSENGAMMEAAIGELHRRVTSGKLQAMDDMNKAMASLEIERVALVRVPTWPWDPGTLRTVVAALLLPILLWLIQFGLERLMR